MEAARQTVEDMLEREREDEERAWAYYDQHPDDDPDDDPDPDDSLVFER